MRLLSCLLALLLAGLPALADSLPPAVPDALLKRMREAPEDVIEDAAALILGYGEADGISAEGIAAFAAVERARARAAEMARIARADLDGDGRVTAGEQAILVRAASAAQRGRLVVAHEAADRDGDGTVDAAETAARIAEAGAGALSTREEAWLDALPKLDLDRDGMVTLDEVRRAVRIAADSAT